jgi:hypothetical protein
LVGGFIGLDVATTVEGGPRAFVTPEPVAALMRPSRTKGPVGRPIGRGGNDAVAQLMAGGSPFARVKSARRGGEQRTTVPPKPAPPPPPPPAAGPPTSPYFSPPSYQAKARAGGRSQYEHDPNAAEAHLDALFAGEPVAAVAVAATPRRAQTKQRSFVRTPGGSGSGGKKMARWTMGWGGGGGGSMLQRVGRGEGVGGWGAAREGSVGSAVAVPHVTQQTQPSMTADVDEGEITGAFF